MAADDGITRRAVLGTIAASAVTAVALTAGQSFGWLAPLNLFAPRVQRLGPQALPVNVTAKAAGVVMAAGADDWRLTVANGASIRRLTLADLHGIPAAAGTLPIACVEGWSTTADWGGVRMSDLLRLVGAPTDASIRIASLQQRGPYRVTTMGPEFAQDPTTLVALRLNGEPLDLDHGYPARVIAPGRPGVLQTKWLSSIEVLA
ncbi:molybdopterin-dependent oxidoreductase [Leifsonia sp. PS1209]|uniref:molybdopterin-dependent oxidoreductase n=1 Tax=Leifsonia sp. PS1209 TaxID=2724914 RepID=UPI001FFC2126|nr:molybdopterin-dependent oxidoreductase [Leifsonia sp. PS1209]